MNLNILIHLHTFPYIHTQKYEINLLHPTLEKKQIGCILLINIKIWTPRPLKTFLDPPLVQMYLNWIQYIRLSFIDQSEIMTSQFFS